MSDVQTIAAHSSGVCDVAFDIAGRHLVSCGSDAILRTYAVGASGPLQPLAPKDVEHDALSLAFANTVRLRSDANTLLRLNHYCISI
jgi:hypothetical protein